MNHQLFDNNKYQILNSKKEHLLGYIKQIENSVASTWEANQQMKTRIQDVEERDSYRGGEARSSGDL